MYQNDASSDDEKDKSYACGMMMLATICLIMLNMIIRYSYTDDDVSAADAWILAGENSRKLLQM